MRGFEIDTGGAIYRVDVQAIAFNPGMRTSEEEAAIAIFLKRAVDGRGGGSFLPTVIETGKPAEEPAPQKWRPSVIPELPECLKDGDGTKA